MADLPAVLDPADPDPRVRHAVRAWLAVQAVFALRPQEACRRLAAGADPESLPHLAAIAAPSERELDRRVRALARTRARLLPLLSPAYPERLRRLPDAPPLLAVRGDPALLRAPAVAIVGARAATHYGRSVARELAATLASAGLGVVSGLALGIDAAAHQGALDAGGTTLAFQACGPDRVYPALNRGLAGRIARSGAVVSELPLGTPPRAPYFPLRNRLISAASLAVVVVEARPRSGSLITARHAADQGVDVFAVPGPITASTSAGPNRLIQEGATPLLCAADILECASRAITPSDTALRRRLEAAAADAQRAQEGGLADAGRGAHGDTATARSILALLRDTPMTRDQLSERLGCSVAELALDLIRLELDGRISEERDGRLRTVAPLGGARL